MTSDRKIIVVPDDLLKRIDNSRGDLERQEFIEMCLDNALACRDVGDSDSDEEVFILVPGTPGETGISAIPDERLPGQK